MAATQAAANGKRAGRDPALTWDIPAAIDPAVQAEHAGTCRAALDEAGHAHVEAIVRQLLDAEDVTAATWAPVVLQLAREAAMAVMPTAVAASRSTDPRRHIKVKRLAGSGAVADSTVIHGIAFRKNVAHKRMRTHVEQPRFVMLVGSLEYQRSKHALSSFDVLIEPEKEYLQNAVGRLVKLRADVLLVERSVARYAQELLVEAGITVALNVKLELLQRVATCTGGQLAASVEVLSESCVGTCELFEVENLGTGCTSTSSGTGSDPDPQPAAPAALEEAATQAAAGAPAAVAAPKSLIMLHGCPHQVGATILLRGADASELTKVKRAVAFASFATYWNRLEAAFIPEQLLAAKLGHGVAGSTSDAVLSSAAQAAERRGTVGILSASPHISTYREPGEREPQRLQHQVISAEVEHNGDETSAATTSLEHAAVVVGEPQTVVAPGAGEAAVPPLLGSEHDASAVLASGDSEQGHAAALATGGIDIYRTQQLWLSISCRNPAKGILCEAPHLHAMPFYRDADLPLTAFIAAAAPPHRKCPHPQCGDGAAQHLRSFVHADGLVTLSSMRLPAVKELPGGEDDALWMWLRPIGNSAELATGIMRLQLPPEAACMSFAHFLALLIDARHLVLGERNLQRGFVRYLGIGPSVLCIHYTHVTPYVMRLPPPIVQLSFGAESCWVQEEIKAITEEADEAFGTLQAALLLQTPALSAGETDGGSAWADNLAETRATFMEALGTMGNTLVGADTTSPSINETSLVEAVQGLNRLRRLLAWVLQQWAAALAKGEAGLGPGVVENNYGPQDWTASPREGGAPRPESHPRQRSETSSAVAVPLSYAAPKLADAGGGTPAGSPPQGDAIPAGLVARYVSLFEDKQQQLFEGAGIDPSFPPGSTTKERLRANPDELSHGAATLLQLKRSPVTIDLCAQPNGSTTGRPILQGGELKPIGEHIAELSTKLKQLSMLLQQPQIPPSPAGSVPLDDTTTTVAGTHEPPIILAIDEHESSQAKDSAASVGSHMTSHFDEWKNMLGRHRRASPANEEGAQAPPVAHLPPSLTEGRAPTATSVNTDGHRSTALETILGSTMRTAGRALLPAGVGGACTTVYDGEPTSLVSYFSSTREYHDYVHEAVRPHLPAATVFDDHTIMAIPVQLDCQMLTEDASYPANRARFQMTAYYAPQFGALRRQSVAGGELAFLASISRCSIWESQGGKSNAYFAKTRDDRYVVKQLSRSERQSFLGFAPDYFAYLSESMSSERATALCKVLGVYQVSVQYPSGEAPPFGGREGVMDMLIMENLFYGRQVDRIYDLKGSSRDRYAVDSDSAEVPVLLDENLRELNQAQPTLVAPEAYERLQRSLWADTGFLALLDVMDYSLLVGFDRDSHELVVGIIDFVRQYTWDKQVESWVKKSGILGGAGKEPTIISPRQYSRRFRAAMLTYFTVVPSLEEPAATLDIDATQI